MTATDEPQEPRGGPALIGGYRVRAHPSPSTWLTGRLAELVAGWQDCAPSSCRHAQLDVTSALAVLATPQRLDCPSCQRTPSRPECDCCGQDSGVRGVVLDVRFEDSWVMVLVLLCGRCKRLEGVR
jgi:hypothetical protein